MPEFYSFERPPQEKVEKLVEELSEHQEIKPRLTFPFSLNENRRSALEMIKTEKMDVAKVLELLKSGDFVERNAAGYLLKKTKIPEAKVNEALPILEKMSEDKDWVVSETSVQSIKVIKFKEKGYLYLLSTQKPLFATPKTKELTERIERLQEISQKLKNKFGDKFIGLTIFGSTAKGYFTAESDLDWGIIAKEKGVLKAFKEMVKSLELCQEHYAGVSEKNEVLSNPDVLFYGLFFGDFDKLRKLQENTLLNMDEKEWDEIRTNIMENETNLVKAAIRFGIEKEELEKLIQFVSLLRIPPPYQEALEIVRTRVKSDR